ncbi:helix-turn-helix domain-containing protein [Halobaculum sp. D14]|uniref:helix-turn-helix domain-containing protein n=1 Tax=Halobaculum sp. D14 TaxID=3421642 RepID=UPI003EB6D9D3
MASGIRATVSFAAPDGCPIAAASTRTASPITQVSTSVSDPDAPCSVTEFIAETDSVDGSGADGEPVFSYGAANLFRTTHDGGDADDAEDADDDAYDDAGGDDSDAGGRCPCECLGAFGCPVHRYVAEDGDLTLVFHASDFQQLQAVMDELRDRFPSVDVQRLLQPPLEGSPEERVFVNRGRLTDRQREVLEAAYERGYFERPKGANATEIAADLGISQSTFTEHLVAAQRKLLEDVLD